MAAIQLQDINVILLDIEGTTTPVDFVYGVLFPYARTHLSEFLTQQGETPDVQTNLAILRQEYDQEAGSPDLPPWSGDAAIAAFPFIEYLMDRDRKSTGLKALQGQVWNQGYADGSLKSQVFDDVPPALRHWHQLGKHIYIYSSGSIQAQKLLFRYTESGDLTPLLSGYFDTNIGSKKEARSYQKIAQSIEIKPKNILFISDIVAELDAAQDAGFTTCLSLRAGNTPQIENNFISIATFDIIDANT